MDSNNWLFGASQNAVGGVVTAILIAMGALLVGLGKAKGWRWATPVLYALMTGASLYILFYGVGSSIWIWGVFLLISIFLVGIISVREYRKGIPFSPDVSCSVPSVKVLLAEIPEEVTTPVWVLPSVQSGVWGIEELKHIPSPSEKIEVRILSGNEGYKLAELLVRMFRLAGWSVQDNPIDASAVFSLPLGKSRQGICLQCRGSELPVAIMELRFVVFFKELLGIEITTKKSEIIADESMQIQIEIGSRP